MRSIALLLPVLLAPACVTASSGDGKVVSSLRDVGPFHGVEASGAIVLDVTVGGSSRVEVLTDGNLQAKVITEIREGILVVRTEGSIDPTGDVKVVVVTEALDRLELSGACDATVRGLSGGELAIDASGASEIDVSGRLARLTIETSGASDIDAGALVADAVRLDVSGASEVIVHARELLDIEASGASKISQRGPGRIGKVDLSGASTLETAEGAERGED